MESVTTIWLGPVPVHVWGVFVAAGMMVALAIAVRRAPRVGIPAERVLDISIGILIAGFVGARLGHVTFYEPSYYLAAPIEILKIWNGGLSSFGAFLIATIVGALLVRRSGISLRRFSDLIFRALPFGFIIGRLGCHITRMHPGPIGSGWGYFPFPDGFTRLDLGLLEAVLWAVIAIPALFVDRADAHPGRVTAVVIGMYALGRFGLDFLRAMDTRYFGLTPAQYGCMVLLVIAVAWGRGAWVAGARSGKSV
ncbi:prolipoprotein diacylglyceryl transferase [Candidatus Uhrbacteria bacterium]|nr:prolipoprotein diacylglyceryl transferase [Candidatus Uhrbacteria bacterium]